MKKKLCISGALIAVMIIAILIIYPSFQKNNDGNREKEFIEENNIIQPYQGTDNYRSQDILDEKCYDENGNIIKNPEYDNDGIMINCYDKFGYQKGKQIGYYENGKVSSIRIVEDGKFIRYYENGHVFEEGNMVKDPFNSENNKKGFILTKNGKRTQYYENGNKELEGVYDKGVAEGRWVYYYENGNIKERGKFKNGYKNEKRRSYHENGNIKEEGEYIDGYRDNKWYFYYSNGNIEEEGNYKEGNAEGKRIFYDESGNIYLGTYQDGEIVDFKGNVETLVTDEYSALKSIYIHSLRNKFKAGQNISLAELGAMNKFFNFLGKLYYTDDSEEFFKEMYNRKFWDLLALYSMMKCGGDISNSTTYLFNLESPQIAQKIYFKNCPKGCRYADEKDLDLMCE